MILKIINLFKNLFFIKIWNIGRIKIKKDKFINLKNLNLIEKNFEKLDIKSKNYTFLADPFPLNKKYILAEAMNKNSIGKLVLIDFNKNQIKKIFSIFKKHISFPFLYFEKKKIYLIPEISHWSNQLIYQYNSKKKKFQKGKTISGLKNLKLKDPIIYKNNNYYFLFYSTKNSKKIEVSFSNKLRGEYKSLKNISNYNSGKRMGGNIISVKKNIYRISQNNSDLYGDGVILNKILRMDNFIFEEKFLKILKFDKFNGPHTINFIGNYLFFDYYILKFDIFAFFKKLRARIIS